MSQIQAGMLALIINSPFNQNLGRVVHVDRFMGEHTSSTGVTKDNCWSVAVDGQPLTGIDPQSGEPRSYHRGIIPAEWLMPIIDLDEADHGAEQGHRA